MTGEQERSATKYSIEIENNQYTMSFFVQQLRNELSQRGVSIEKTQGSVALGGKLDCKQINNQKPN